MGTSGWVVTGRGRSEADNEWEHSWKLGFCMQKPNTQFLLVEQVALHQLLEQFIPVKLADHTPGTVVIGDVGGILGEKVADDLVDGVVALFAQSVEYTAKDSAHVLFVIAGDREFDGIIARHVIDLLCIVGIL